jgi:hypothetical protein
MWMRQRLKQGIESTRYSQTFTRGLHILTLGINHKLLSILQDFPSIGHGREMFYISHGGNEVEKLLKVPCFKFGN